MRRPLLLSAPAAALLTAAALLAPPHLPAQAGAPSPALDGRWAYLGDPAEGQAQIDQQVERAIAQLSFDMQDMARDRIAETAFVPPFIEIATNAGQLHLEYGGPLGRVFEGPPGQPSNVYSPSGVRAASTLRVRPDGSLEHQLRAADGNQINHLSIEGDNLVLSIHMESVRFNRPIDFQLRYRR
jgi:hypothetical protein